MEQMIIAISVAVIALTCVIVGVYLVKTLISARSSLKTADWIMKACATKLQDLEGEGIKLLQHTNEMASDVQTKMKSFDALFHAISQVGEALDRGSKPIHKNSAISSKATEAAEGTHSSRERLLEVLEWAVVGISLWQNIKNHRRN